MINESLTAVIMQNNVHTCAHVYFSGTHSYKEHGFRLLMIWLHGVRKDENVMRLSFEALSATERRNLAGISIWAYFLNIAYSRY